MGGAGCFGLGTGASSPPSSSSASSEEEDRSGASLAFSSSCSLSVPVEESLEGPDARPRSALSGFVMIVSDLSLTLRPGRKPELPLELTSEVERTRVSGVISGSGCVCKAHRGSPIIKPTWDFRIN